MVDNPAAIKQFHEANGHECLLMLLNMGSDLGKELAAGAIWKVCAADDSGKTQYTAAVGGLVRLLRSEQESSHEQAAGALRSICVSSPQNKLELNRVNGIGALVTTLWNRSAKPCAKPCLPVACIFRRPLPVMLPDQCARLCNQLHAHPPRCVRTSTDTLSCGAPRARTNCLAP